MIPALISGRRAAVAAACLILAIAGPIPRTAAQNPAHSTDPNMQRARRETQIILDLGRLINFVDRMEQEQRALRLSPDQARRLVRLMGEIKSTSRMTPALAERMMEEIEDDILTPRQLMYTDRIWAEAERNASGGSVPGSGTSSRARGGQSGTEGTPAPGSIASYAAGGPYNPLADTSRPQGEQFEAFYQRLRQSTASQ